MKVLTAIIAPIILYLGPGLFLSRFCSGKIRNFPVFWMLLSIITIPMAVSILAIGGLAAHISILAICLIALVIGIFLTWENFECPLLHLPKTILCSYREYAVYISLLVVFFVALIIPKSILLRSDSLAIPDDFERVKVVVSAGFDLNELREWGNFEAPMAYHYFDYVIPGIVFRTTGLSADTAWFLHNAIEYVVMLTVLLVTALLLFRSLVARLFFLLGSTIAGGGIESVIFRILNIPLMDSQKDLPYHIEWWSGRLMNLNSGAKFQISSFYTLFLWVPHHIMAGIIALLIAALFFQKSRIIQMIGLPALLGALSGFSVFVFITAGTTYIALMAVMFVRKISTKNISRRVTILTACVQAAVFLLFFLPQGVQYIHASPTEGVSSTGEIIPTGAPQLQFFQFPDSIPWIHSKVLLLIETVLNSTTTALFTLLIDTGVIAILAIAYFFLPNSVLFSKKQRSFSLGLAVFIVIPFTIVLLKSIGSQNDLFMRGIIPAQIAVLIGAAFFVDFMSQYTRKFPAILAMILLLQAPSFFLELKGRSSFGEGYGSRPMVAYIRAHVPKNAVVYTNTNSCGHYQGDLIFLANRMCKEIDTFEPLAEIAKNYSVYFYTDTMIHDDHFRILYSEDGFLYRYIADRA